MCVFKNTNQKNICASIVFKAESKPKHDKTFFFVGGGGFLQKPKRYFLKLKFQICIFCVCSLMSKEASCQFSQKNIIIWAPWNLLKMKTLTRARRNFEFGLLKSYLTVGYLTCSDRSKKISTLHPTVEIWLLYSNYVYYTL